jgi:general secretion pathway protein D
VTFVSGKGLSKGELYDAFLAVLQVHNFDAVESGNLIKIVPANKARAQVAPVVKDSSENNADETVTEVVKLNYIQAQQSLGTLMPLAGQGGETRIQANQASNSIVITGRAQNVQRIREIIHDIDKPNNETFELVALQYALASQVATTLQGLMGSSTPGVEGAIPSTGKISADERTNSVLIAGDKATRERLRAAIEKLDIPKASEGDTKVIQLRYAKAEDVVAVLNGVSPALQKQTAASAPKELNQAAVAGAAGTTGMSASVNGVTVLADKSSNAVIISGPPTLQKNMMKVIAQLDRRRAQVLVEAIIAEVSTDLSNKIGVGLVANGITTNQAGLIGVSNFGGIASAVSAYTTKSIPGGFVMGGGSDSFAAIMEALKGDAATNILSTPTLVTLDNEAAEIVVGQEVPFKTGSSTKAVDGTTNPFTTIERKDVGLSFKITPQINRGKTVNLKIEQENSNVATATVEGASDLITNKRKISTNVMVDDGQILILGGLIEDNFKDSESKVPVLGDIPVLGSVFRNNTKSAVKRNLMVFIHPVIMPDGMSADAYTRQKYNTLQQYQANSQYNQRGLNRGGLGTLPNLDANNSVDTLHRLPAVPLRTPQVRQVVKPQQTGCHGSDPFCNGTL